jgi:hypothetical protein
MTSTSYPADAQDWRGRFVANMAASLGQRPEINLSLWAPPGNLASQVVKATTVSDVQWLASLSAHGGIAQVLRKRKLLAAGTVAQLMTRMARAYRRTSANVLHVNWLQNALPLWGTRTPALITVLGTDFALLRLPGMKTAIRAVLRQRRAILAPNAAWMCPALADAFGDLAEVRPIAFGVDDAWLNLKRTPPADNIQRWLAITRLTTAKIGDLFAWGDGLFNAQRQLHLFGPMQEQIDIPQWVHYHGPTHPQELLRDWFPQATGLITLSRHDEGRPQVMLEAMAAGLPVLASDLPAHRNMLQHRQTGWLAVSREDVAQGLDWLETPANNQVTGEAARRWIKDTIGTWDDCAARYALAYRDLLERSG